MNKRGDGVHILRESLKKALVILPIIGLLGKVM